MIFFRKDIKNKLIFLAHVSFYMWLGALFLNPSLSQASPGVITNSAYRLDFTVSSRLRPRVNFWKDIFTKYGRDHAVIHHRERPYVIFKVLDFSTEAKILNPSLYKRHRDAVVNREIKLIQEACKNLAKGLEPQDFVEQQVANLMELVPGGIEKYKRAFSEDLIRSQTGIKERFQEAVQRSGRYMSIMEQIFSDYNLPVELTRLPFVESSFDYTAYSSVGAAGIWQFMRATGKSHGLKITTAVDERRDPIEATHAAAQYLKNAYQVLGTWPLALTSYNHGVGGVSKAVRNLGTTDIATIVEHPTVKSFGFASNNFYPEFVAALEIYENHHFYFPNLVIEPRLRFDQIMLERPLSVGQISSILGVSLDELLPLNYAILTSAWQGRTKVPAGYLLKIPPGVGSLAARLNAPSLQGAAPPVSAPATSNFHAGTTYKVRKGDTLESIAKKYRMTLAQLKQANKLSAKSSNINVGQILSVGGSDVPVSKPKITATPKPKPTSTPKKTLSLSEKKQLSESRVVYEVKKGDNLYDIAKSYGTSVDRIKKTNSLGNIKLMPGDKIIIDPDKK